MKKKTNPTNETTTIKKATNQNQQQKPEKNLETP